MSKIYTVTTVKGRERSVYTELLSDTGDVRKYRLSIKLWEKFNFSVGDTVDSEAETKLREASETCEAVTKAMKYLSEGSYSAKALYDKLKLKGFSKESAEKAIAMAIKSGYIDEKAQSESLAELLVIRKLYGPLRVTSALCAKGYPSKLAKSASESVSDELYSAALEAAVSKKCKNGVPSDEKFRSKIIASLVRLGYSYEQIRKYI